MSRRLFVASCAAVAFALAALTIFMTLSSATSAGGQAMRLPVDPRPLVVETRTGAKTFSIEIADDAGERSRGLMFREDMADDRGMLFVFGETQQVGFWMRNTPMPLDLIFIGQDGRVKAIRQGEPYSDATIGPAEPVRFVLEVKQGIAASSGIGAGDLVRHPVVSGAHGAGSPG